MKAKMRVPYENGVWSAVGYGLAFAFLVPLTVALAFKAKQYIGALICVVCAFVLLRGAWKRFGCGMRINEKRVVLRSWQEKKVVPYDAVREMVVTFTQEKIVACIKTQDGEEMHFAWKEIVTDSTKTFPGLGWGYRSSAVVRIGVRMTDRFVAKSTERLSRCEKVRVEDRRSSEW